MSQSPGRDIDRQFGPRHFPYLTSHMDTSHILNAELYTCKKKDASIISQVNILLSFYQGNAIGLSPP
ncbi:MAG: hypothetical protein D6820_14365 [Lentisphaerae bacterium]|nr:MAG: hypothetical protein D6820_14365 [Lentisphaerota bacterium]